MSLSKMEMENRAQAGGMNVLGNAAGLLKQFGVEPNEILPRLFAADEGDKGGGWIEALPKLLGVAAEVAKASMSGKGGPPQLAMAHRPALPPPGFQNPAMMGPDPFRGNAPEQMFGAPGPGPAPAGPPPLPLEPTEPESEPLPETPQQEQTRQLSTVAAENGVPLKAQKDARVELRRLVRRLSDAPAGEWLDHILTSLQNELAIYHYIKAVTVSAALMEAGADPPLADAITTAMKSSQMVPSDLPYDWSDL